MSQVAELVDAGNGGVSDNKTLHYTGSNPVLTTMTKQEEYFWKKDLQEEFQNLTKHFDLDDWREVRTENYWKSDQIANEVNRLEHKLRFIRHYERHGKPFVDNLNLEYP